MGPPARPDNQTHWDPDAQTMDTERLRDLQLSRLRHLVDDVFRCDVGLFRAKLDEAGIENSADITSLDDINKIPTTLKQDLRDAEARTSAVGQLSLHSAGWLHPDRPVHRDHRHPDGDRPDPPRLVVGVRISGAQLVAKTVGGRARS